MLRDNVLRQKLGLFRSRLGEMMNDVCLSAMESETGTSRPNCRCIVCRCRKLLAACEAFVEVNARNGYEFDSNEPAIYGSIVAAITDAKK